VSSLVLLNTYYGQAPTLRFPEWVSLFADPAYAALARAITEDLTVAQWLFRWQGRQFNQGSAGVPEGFLQMIWPQFAATPGTFPAVLSLTSDLHATLQANTQRIPDLKRFHRPVRIIFGVQDPYLNTGVAQSLHEALPTSELSLLPEKGHWPQLDGAPAVAQFLLSLPETSLT
jgi:haloalkane dehalogenase